MTAVRLSSPPLVLRLLHKPTTDRLRQPRFGRVSPGAATLLLAPVSGAVALAFVTASSATPVLTWICGWGSFSLLLVVELLVDAAVRR